jgi:hypothetical protein
MDRRFSNATSSLASAALKFCTELANYWHAIRELVSRYAGVDGDWNPGIAPRARGRVCRALHPADPWSHPLTGDLSSAPSSFGPPRASMCHRHRTFGPALSRHRSICAG